MPRTDRDRTDAPRIDDSRELASGSTCRETLFAGGATEGLAGATEGLAGAAEGPAGATEGRPALAAVGLAGLVSV